VIGCLLAYDAAGDVVATLDYMVARDDDGNVVGLIDFAAHEDMGGRLRDIWEVGHAAGSGSWPEWLGARAHEFSVELDGRMIAALVHRRSGHRRLRAAILAAIDAAPSRDGARDLRGLLGGPGRPLTLDEDGRTVARRLSGTPAHLPLIGGR
jgi:hypothetical protein